MLFSSISFLYFFLPIVILTYFLAPKQAKNYVLLLASLLFYGWGESKYVFLMIGVILIGYVLGLFIEQYRNTFMGKIYLTVAIAVDVLTLGYFKYADFFIDNFNNVTGLSVPLLKIALPIGISFYIFQILSYKIDVYRGNVAAQKNPFLLAAYVSMFPQLIAGPIVRYIDIEQQLRERSHSIEMISAGIQRFIIGLSKKVLLANALGECCQSFKASDEKSILFYWMYAIGYMLHIYFDFSGYSDMAIGLGKIFGFHFMENFNYPYISTSITEFWRRWHISLGSWFRDYIYIPLGGNRVSKGRWVFNIFAVWFLTGFWHGASWNFILWGLYFVIFLLVEKIWLMPYLQKSKIGSHLYVLFFVMISFIIFDSVNLKEAFQNIGGLLGVGTDAWISPESLYYLKQYMFLYIAAILGSSEFPKKCMIKLQENTLISNYVGIFKLVLSAAALLVVTSFLVDGSFNPFLYFRF